MHYETVAGIGAPTRTPPWIKPLALQSADVLAALVAASISLPIANLLRGEFDLSPVGLTEVNFRLQIINITILTLVLFLWFRSKRHYRQRQALADQVRAVIGGSAVALITAAAIQFATIELGSRILTSVYWILLVPLLILARLIVRAILRATNSWTRPALVLTSSCRVNQLARFIDQHDELGIYAVATVTLDDLSVEDAITQISAVADKHHTILYAPSSSDRHQIEVSEALVLSGTPFILSLQMTPVPDRAVILEFPPEDISMIEIHNSLARPIALACKRAFDLIVASASLVLLAPLLAPLIMVIRADGGPAFFCQKRIGLNGKAFNCLKLRSMTADAETRLQHMIRTDPAVAAEWKTYQKLHKDPRITRIGAFIRCTSLDEIPQLINVLRGDMSIVGPRPMIEAQIEEYGRQFEAYIRMRPGITGLWQTNGRNDTTFRERARLDAFYVRNWSLWRDFVILARTVREIIFARSN